MPTCLFLSPTRQEGGNIPRWYIQSTHSVPIELWVVGKADHFEDETGPRWDLRSPSVSWVLLEAANLGSDSYWGTKPVFTSLNR